LGIDNILFQKIRSIVLKHIKNEMLVCVHLSSCPYNGNKQRIFVDEFHNDDRENCINAFEGAIDDVDIIVYRFENKIIYGLKEEVEAIAGF
jgi:hypothetical protein